MAENRTQRAKEIFKSLVNSEPGLYREIAEWNVVLAHLKLNETADVKKQLDVIIRQKEHIYFKEATSLSEEFYFTDKLPGISK
ncbi:MAG: hypothetical protein ABIS36_12630 [Chryseolinea sp.]